MLLLQLGLVFLISAGLAAWLSGPSGRAVPADGAVALAGGFGAGALMMLPQGWLDPEPAAGFILAGAAAAGAGALHRQTRLGTAGWALAALLAALMGLAGFWWLPAYGRVPALPLLGWAPPWAGFMLMTLIITGLAGLGRRLSPNGGGALVAAMVLALVLAPIAYLQGAYCHSWMIAAFGASIGGFYIYNRALTPGPGGGLWLGLTPGLLAGFSAETIGLDIWLPALGLYAMAIWMLARRAQKNA